MKSLLRKIGFKKYGSNSHSEGGKSHHKNGSHNHYSSAQNVNNAFRVGGAWQSSAAPAAPGVNNYHRVQSFPGEDSTGVSSHPQYLIPPLIGYPQNSPQPAASPAHLASSPDIVQGYNHHSPLNRKATGDDSFNPGGVYGVDGLPLAAVMPSNRPQSGIFAAKEEHTPDLLSSGEQQQTIPFHSPLWMKRDFPSRSSMRRKAASGRRLPPDMNVRFTDFGNTLESGCDEIMTDSEVIRRKHGLGGGINSLLGKFTEPSDVETDTQTDLESNHSGRRGKKGKRGVMGHSGGSGGTKFFSRHASLKIKGGKRRGEKPSVSPVNEQVDGQTVENGGRRASVPESKRSLTDTEQQYESEAENSVFSIGFSTSNLKFTNNRSHNNADHFKRLGSTGNLMRKPFSSKNSVPGCHSSENEMTDSARSVKKSASSDNFHARAIPSSGSSSSHSVKHKVGQGLAHSSLISSGGSKSSRKQSKANTEDTMVSLFEAVEVCNLDKVVEILSYGAIRDINIPNEDDFTILDMATLLNFDVMAAELLKHGARENPKFMVKEMRVQHVTHLLKRCDSQIHSLVPALVTAAQGSASNSQKVAKETELRFWEWRQRLLAKMKACFELAKAPDPPSKVDISVVSPTSIKVSFSPPKNTNGSLVTRYKLSWSRARNFEVVEGEHIIMDLRDLCFVIRGLSSGVEMFVRVCAANIKGFGNCQISSPPSATPSHWRDISNKERRCSGKKVTELSLMFEQIKYSCLSSSTIPGLVGSPSSETSANNTSSPAKRSAIKHLLPPHPKFIKNLNKGVYLSCALYTPDDKVVVTSDDVIPTVEVDEGTPANISQDFHWFLKLSVVWDDIPTLCGDLSADSSNTSISFRAKLIQAVFSLQALLSWRDIGRVYHRVLRDNHGNMIFVLIGHLPDNKCPNGSGVKLSPLSKIINKRKSKLDQSLNITSLAGGTLDSGVGSNNTSSGNAAANGINSSSLGGAGGNTANMSFLDEFSALDMLFLDLEELIRFHQNQEASLKPGLYLTLLKAESSINTLNVQVPSNCPNMTTCVKIRENPHVSKEEWVWIYNSTMPVQYKAPSENSSSGTPNFPQPQPVVPGLTPCQANFRRSLAIAAGKLFRKLAIKDDNGYRIHKDEIIEVNSDVTVIAMLPPEVTSVNKYSDSINTSQNNSLATANLVPLTVQLFEFTHLLVYQHYITSAYCRLCCLTDTLTLVANYQIREAFTDEEMRVAKSRLEILNETADKTETIWHSMRWLLGILQQNRMSRNSLGVPLKTLLDISVSPDNPPPSCTVPSSNQGHPKRLSSHSADAGKLIPVTINSIEPQTHSTPQNNQYIPPRDASSGNRKSGNMSSKCLVLQVYPRFNCGLPRGTSVRVVVDSKATCKVVVQLVVSELSKAALNHNPQAATWDPNPDLFQLCVVLGAGTTTAAGGGASTENMEHSLPENLPLVSCSDYQQPNSVKYIVKLKTNANYFPKYSDI